MTRNGFFTHTSISVVVIQRSCTIVPFVEGIIASLKEQLLDAESWCWPSYSYSPESSNLKADRITNYSRLRVSLPFVYFSPTSYSKAYNELVLRKILVVELFKSDLVHGISGLCMYFHQARNPGSVFSVQSRPVKVRIMPVPARIAPTA